MRCFLCLIILIPVSVFCQSPEHPAVYPDSNWRAMTNVDSSWQPDRLRQLRKFIVDSTEATGVVIIQAGKLLFEYGDTKELSYLASCRKSVLSLLYGPFVKEGLIDLNTTIGQLGVDDIGGLLPLEQQATIKDLLTARSGVYHPASNEGDATAMAPKRGTVKPGAFWLYNNWDFNLAGAILEKKTERDIYQLIDSLLAKPLQMQDWDIKAQRKTGDTTRSKYKAYHMWFSTRDMARIGYLMLRNGRWKNQQIIPAEWVKKITSIVTTYSEAARNNTAYYHFAYGYLWWIWDQQLDDSPYKGAYTATGAFGQFITVLPRLDIVVAFKTKYEYERQTSTDTYLRFLNRLMDARK